MKINFSMSGIIINRVQNHMRLDSYLLFLCYFGKRIRKKYFASGLSRLGNAVVFVPQKNKLESTHGKINQHYALWLHSVLS